MPWVPFAELETALTRIPTEAAGVYVVVRDHVGEPAWLVPSPVGETWRGDPTVASDVLQANWVPGAAMVYIGKAKRGQLRNRLRAYLRFGQGRGGRHWGGRLIWQLEDAWKLRVAWRVESVRDALDVESELLAAFRAAHDQRSPFANNNPDRMGR